MHSLSKVDTLPARAERECNEYLKELKLLVSREKPTNVIQFCIDFFLQKKIALLLRLDYALGQEREVSSATAPEASNEEPASPPPISNRGRRSSVFSESIDPLALPILRTEFPKSAIDKTMITSALCENFLFNHMEDEQYEAIVSALKEVRIKAHLILVEQGVFDDHFFIVRSGSFDCFTDHVKVATLGPGKSFGELALLHRAAAPCTVIASSDSVVWHLDRLTFRTILAGMSAQRRSLYNDFLRQVPLFGILDENDRRKIADTLTTMHFADEEIVCCEGSCSNAFYFILTGQVAVYQRDGSEFRFIRTLNPGDHFGESALLNNVPQTSTIIARGSLKCATITKDAFFRLVGPLLVHRAEIAPLPRQVSCL